MGMDYLQATGKLPHGMCSHSTKENPTLTHDNRFAKLDQMCTVVLCLHVLPVTFQLRWFASESSAHKMFENLIKYFC